MNFLKFLAVAVLVVSVAVPAFAKERKIKVKSYPGKIVTSQETLGIELAKDIADPDRPRPVRQGNDFTAVLYDGKSLAWDNFSGVEKLSSGVGGYVFRLTVDASDVEGCLEEMHYWPGVDWYQPVRTFMEFKPSPHVAYEFTAPASANIPRYRVKLSKGNKVVYIPLKHKMFGVANELNFDCGDRVRYSLDDMEPMSHLARVYAYWTAMKGEDVRIIRSLYWRTIATSWSMVMGATAPLDEDGYYHSTEWFFDEFAYALFPGIDWPDLRREDHVLWFAERPEPYVIRRRTFDINDVRILKQWREGDELVVAMNVERDRGDRIVHVHMTPASLKVHPFAWKIEKGVIQ
ncbi:MAG: hypothetical protein MJ041_02400 [Acidaminococcaceae bacterium]|nr:hypothetical protein [Acidaminococcaceae bacterium]